MFGLVFSYVLRMQRWLCFYQQTDDIPAPGGPWRQVHDICTIACSIYREPGPLKESELGAIPTGSCPTFSHHGCLITSTSPQPSLLLLLTTTPPSLLCKPMHVSTTRLSVVSPISSVQHLSVERVVGPPYLGADAPPTASPFPVRGPRITSE